MSDGQGWQVIVLARAWVWQLIPAHLAVNVYLPKDRVTGSHQGYGFVEFRSEEDADYVSCRWQ